VKRKRKSNFLVIGSGIAGLSFGLNAAEHGSVTIVTKKTRKESNTNYAQGGMAMVMNFREDSFESHVEDTMRAGSYLNDREIVEIVVREGPERVKELIDLGVSFSKRGDEFDLGIEGGHSHRRIIHAKDFTGAEIEKALIDACDRNKNIEIIENAIAIDLITLKRLELRDKDDEDEVVGAYIFDITSGDIITYIADITVLATGGCGRIYLHTTNPSIATGDGIAIAYRAGAKVDGLEFVQFHPTSLFHPEGNSFLISEAVRGEGGVLMTVSEYKEFIQTKDRSEEFSFMRNYDDMGSLATRDVVARAIDRELKKSGDEFVYLVINHEDSKMTKERFPYIYETCLRFGIDITKDPIPVVPAAHYIVGGVSVTKDGLVLDRNEDEIMRLYAIGEVASTGFHGANRLASNSLLESLVFAHRAYVHSVNVLGSNLSRRVDVDAVPLWDDSEYKPIDEKVMLKHDFDEIRRLMWNYVGIVRSDARLKRALRRLKNLEEDISRYYWSYVLTDGLIELRNIILVAKLIVEASIKREENIGLFFNIDREAS
jgi:L-aspartate oxidase